MKLNYEFFNECGYQQASTGGHGFPFPLELQQRVVFTLNRI